MTPKELFVTVKDILEKNYRSTDTLVLHEVISKKTDELSSVRIQFKNAPSYALISMNVKRKTGQINIHRKYEDDMRNKLLPFTFSTTKSDEVWLHADIVEPEELEYISDILVMSYDDSPFREPFACCSQYEKCSDALKCLHADQQYAKACLYRRNLEAGKIFYGKNKNI